MNKLYLHAVEKYTHSLFAGFDVRDSGEHLKPEESMSAVDFNIFGLNRPHKGNAHAEVDSTKHLQLVGEE